MGIRNRSFFWRWKQLTSVVIISLLAINGNSRTVFNEDFESGQLNYFTLIGSQSAHVSTVFPGKGSGHLVSTELGETKFHLSTINTYVFDQGESYVISFLCAAEGYFRFDQLKLWVSEDFGSDQAIIPLNIKSKHTSSGYQQIIITCIPEKRTIGFLNLAFDNLSYNSASSRIYLDELTLIEGLGSMPNRPEITFAHSNISGDIYEIPRLVELAGMPIITAEKPYNDGYEMIFSEELILLAGKQYEIHFKSGEAQGDHKFVVFVDFNQDGDFEDELEVQNSSMIVSENNSHYFRYEIPSELLSGIYTIRIRFLMTSEELVDAHQGMNWGKTTDIVVTMFQSWNNQPENSEPCSFYDLNGKQVVPNESVPAGIYLRSCNGQLEKIFLGIDIPN